MLPNSQSAYQTLSSRSEEARRSGEFPDLIDRTSKVHRTFCFSHLTDASRCLQVHYRRDRTAGQFYSVYIEVEKNGMVNQLTNWIGDMGIPVLALGGYSSQTYIDEIVQDIYNRGGMPFYSMPETSTPLGKILHGILSSDWMILSYK